MRGLRCFISLFSLLSIILTPSISAQDNTQKVGLVLSGGGAKGIAHVGAIQALEDNGIPVDYITGTSMGAIIGALYACGYTPAEMMDLLLSPRFIAMSKGQTPPNLTYYFARQTPSPEMGSFPLGATNDSIQDTHFNPQSLIPPTPMAFGFMEIFSAYSAQCGGDFAKLFVPFRCVASNATQRQAKVWRKGYLADAVRSSMSFPLVFQAIKVDGDILYDGGIYDNFPVNVMEEDFKPDVMIGIDVSASDEGAPNSFLDQLSLLVYHPQSYSMPEDKGIKLRMPVQNFSLLDFEKAQEIYNVGYAYAMKHMEAIKARIKGRRPAIDVEHRRTAFKSHTPQLRFDRIKVQGGTHSENKYLEYLFHPDKGRDTIGLDHARLAFYRAMSSGKIQNLTPKALPTPDTPQLFTLGLDANVKKSFAVGAGGYITTSTNSFLFLRGSYSSLSFNSIGTDISAWLGQTYIAGSLRGALDLRTSMPSALRFTAVASRRKYSEDENLFFRDSEPAFLTAHQYFGRLSWAMAVGRSGEFETTLGGGRLYNSFYQSHQLNNYNQDRDYLAMDLMQAALTYTSSTLNHVTFPTSGTQFNTQVMALCGQSELYQAPVSARMATTQKQHQAWYQFNLDFKDYFDLGRHWAFGVETRGVASTRELLSSYTASVSAAPSFTPTPASHNIFDPSMRANSFIALGLTPVYKYNSNLQGRLSLNAFLPARPILANRLGEAYYGEWFSNPRFFGELDVVYRLPFGALSAYCNYSTNNKINLGVAFGLYIEAPSFLEF